VILLLSQRLEKVSQIFWEYLDQNIDNQYWSCKDQALHRVMVQETPGISSGIFCISDRWRKERLQLVIIESMPYEIILTTHIASFIWNVSFVVVADLIGLLWVLGKMQLLPQKVMLYTHRLIWLGLLTSIVTGIFMFVELKDYLLETPAFYTKIIFVMALVINSFFISKHLKNSFGVGSFSNLDKKDKRSFFISGAVSTVSWIVVFLSAGMLGL
jgi:hypothetical protein